MGKLITRSASAALISVVAGALLLAATTVASPTPRTQAEGACNSTIDLMFVLDGSESINWAQFGLVKTFAGDLVGRLVVSPTDGHVGVVQFAGDGEGIIEVALTGDLTTIQAGIAGMTQIVGVTDIQEGIALGQEQFTLNGRDGIPHVMIVLTDGAHNEPGDPIVEAAAAKALGTEIFAIAIGDGPKIGELNSIVSEAAETHVFAVDDFEELVTILEPLAEVVCQPKPTATPAATTEAATPTDGPAPTPTLVSDALGVTELPATGAGLPSDWPERAGWLSVQALAGLGSALALVAAGYVVTNRRQRQ